MNQDAATFLDKLKHMDGTELKVTYMKVFDERPHSHRREWMRNRIAWGYQAKLENGMSQKFIDHGLMNADLSELRVAAPKEPIRTRRTEPETPSPVLAKRDPRIPPPGTVLERNFKGQHIAVKILEHGFEWNGHVFPSFSAAVKTATGKSYSPFSFFKLGSKPKAGA